MHAEKLRENGHWRVEPVGCMDRRPRRVVFLAWRAMDWMEMGATAVLAGAFFRGTWFELHAAQLILNTQVPINHLERR
jgi:hypothetical protein